MGDVLVYVESPVNDRLLAFARPLADAAGGDSGGASRKR